jgi:poly(hydroxyalkanoate) depolymerase family esterase
MQDAEKFAENSGLLDLAKRWGFLLLFKERRRSNNLTGCCNWFSPEDTGRYAGEVLPIRQMIDRTRPAHGVDRQRIYVTGTSIGAAMTLALLSSYPEVFSAGAPLASSLPSARSGPLGTTATASRG